MLVLYKKKLTELAAAAAPPTAAKVCAVTVLSALGASLGVVLGLVLSLGTYVGIVLGVTVGIEVRNDGMFDIVCEGTSLLVLRLSSSLVSV